jgi:hypothetical protein
MKKNDKKSKKVLQIRNSTAEFLIFASQANENTIEVRVEDETVWLTQKLIGELFDKSRNTITEHLQNIFKEGELDENSVCREFRHTGTDGKEYNTKFYNLDAIISVGYRVNSLRATQFRQWATGVLRDFAIRGYVLDKEVCFWGQSKNSSSFFPVSWHSCAASHFTPTTLAQASMDCNAVSEEFPCNAWEPVYVLRSASVD